MDRKVYNKLILERLKYIIDKYPDLRFGQILVNCNIIQLEEYLCQGEKEKILIGKDPFYEESKDTLERMKLTKFAFPENFN